MMQDIGIVHLVFVGDGDEMPLELDGVERFQYGGQRTFVQRSAAGPEPGFTDLVDWAADDAVQRAQPLGKRRRANVQLSGRRDGAALEISGNRVGRPDQQHSGPVPVVVRVRIRRRARLAQFDRRQVASRVLAGRVVRVPASRRRARPDRRLGLDGGETATAVMTRRFSHGRGLQLVAAAAATAEPLFELAVLAHHGPELGQQPVDLSRIRQAFRLHLGNSVQQRVPFAFQIRHVCPEHGIIAVVVRGRG